MNDNNVREQIMKLNDKSGKMFREKYLKNNYIDFYNTIIKYAIINNLELPFKEKVYHFLHDIPNNVLCSECNNKVKFKNSTIGYLTYCSKKCSDKSTKTKIKRKNTCIKNFGTKTPAESKSVLYKMYNTNIKKYGVKTIFENNNIKEKIKQTNIKKYGVENPLQNKTIYEKVKKTKQKKYKNENYNNREKFKNTMISLYGVEHALQNSDIKTKATLKLNNTLMTKYLKYYPEYDIIDINVIDKKYRMKCDKGHIFDISYTLLTGRRKTNTIICTKCNPINNSISDLEIKLKNFIEKNYNKTIIYNDRKILNGKELDIYLPDINLAIEFNGLFWHNELHKDKKYHINKTNACLQNNIFLFHIYEDDWTTKKEIIKSMLLNKFKISQNKIYARKTEIREINNINTVREFLNMNHLQGFVGSKIKLGLYHNNELVSLMTFGRNRLGIGVKKYDYELLRFCNKINTNVIGGASKLFKYFIKIYKPNNIVSYADRSYSDGKLYETLNFNFSHNTKESYHYVVDKIRLHRFNFRKNKIVNDKNKHKTEHEIMNDNNIYRIYNSGHKCYIWTNY